MSYTTSKAGSDCRNQLSVYQDNILKYDAIIVKLAKTVNRLSVLRLITFVLSVTFIIVLANERLATLLLLVVLLFIATFVFLIRRYNQAVYLKRNSTFLKEINESEVLRSENKLSEFTTGQTFLDRNHSYASDLDIFGSHSLFQLINRTTTESGTIRLAKWLSEPATCEVIIERQHAIKDLSSKLDWRQQFQASGKYFESSKSDYNKLLEWIRKPVQLLPYHSKYLIVSIFLTILSTCATAYFIVHLTQVLLNIHTLELKYVTPLLIILIINYLVLRRLRPIAEEIIKDTRHNIKILGGYKSLITQIESERFDSEILKQLQLVLSDKNYSASAEIYKLKRVLEVFHLRGIKKEALSSSFIYSFFNIFWLLDAYCIVLTEKWKSRNRFSLELWASAVSEFEALSSLAGFAYSNPKFVFPEIVEESHIIHFEALGHPLISTDKRVYNCFDVRGRGQTIMITGSNMAGKSTFLRTIGINLVLALMGAPCCAKSGQVSRLRLFTSMRTQDNLEEGVSSFYAELTRIKKLLKLLESDNVVFFLLDEMFKGTNSKDRHKGGFSLIKQLEELNAFGIISTHDLELAILAENHNLVTNYSFNSEISGDEIIFNYRLTDGICTDFNASELMKKSGIKVLPHVPDE